jgi:predicted acylesterase/phospholipase RssA
MNSKRESNNVRRAKDILRGQSASLSELVKLADALKEEKAFGHARKILQRTCSHSELPQQSKLHTRLIQQHSLCTYKDPELPAEEKFDRALTILAQLGDLRTTTDQETLGLTGAIHKYKWEAFGQKQYLEQSLAFYLRGYNLGIASDYGYTAINAAFVLDLLASLEREEEKKTGLASELPASRQQKAKTIREEIITALPPLAEQTDNAWLNQKWWFFATVAEAYFGLAPYAEGYYNKAREWLEEGVADAKVPEWERETTARQLAALARLHAGEATQSLEDTLAWKVIRDFLGAEYAAGLRGIFLGKVGLALSGGGFRASLFHIGVLARLAELDMLRHVEVLSCVSGGSIVGAHYYLEVQRLLQKKDDAQVTRDDYIRIVKSLQDNFLAGVQSNIRVQLLGDITANARMVFFPNTYSRTQRAGELYEKELFAKVDDGKQNSPRYMDDLLIHPVGEPENFAPKRDNWRRAAKVPILVLNATSLNTGHSWQFTATWMGEPSSVITTAIDGNERLRRMYYDEAPLAYIEKKAPRTDRTKIRLGHAVAASACVPGIFDPITFPGLYEHRTVRLVDGGVHDNQGIASLLEQDCTVLLVSDASGQMETQAEPSNGILGSPLRSSTISQTRVREVQYRELDARRRSSLLRGLMFIHLKKDLPSKPVPWIDREDQQDDKESIQNESNGLLTPYGIRKDVQELLAAIRTDLDSFSHIEAYALMTSGYRMTEHEFPRSLQRSSPSPVFERWGFLDIEEAMKRREGAAELKPFLGISSELFLKVWRLAPHHLQVAALTPIVLLVLGFLWACWQWASFPLLTLGMIGTTLIILIVGAVIGKTLLRVVYFRQTLVRICLGIGLSLFASLFARLHLKFFDPWYLRLGHIDRLQQRSGAVAKPPSTPAGTVVTELHNQQVSGAQ